MSLTPTNIGRPTSIMVTTMSYESPMWFKQNMQTLGSGQGSNSWGTANRALYVPVYIQQPSLFVKAFWLNGTTVSGNIDVGLYDDSWNRIISTGSTAQAVVSSVQEVDIADLTVAPGIYYLAISCSSATATLLSIAAQDALRLPVMGLAQQATAFPLPNPATPALCTHLNVPTFGFSRRTLV